MSPPCLIGMHTGNLEFDREVSIVWPRTISSKNQTQVPANNSSFG